MNANAIYDELMRLHVTGPLADIRMAMERDATCHVGDAIRYDLTDNVAR